MFSANGRASKSTETMRTRASIRGKEFVCSACNERKRITRVEFGELVRCDKCGNPMLESYDE